MNFDFWILTVCATANILLGLLVYVRNPKLTSNKRFALLSCALVSWTVFNYLSDHASGDSANALLFTRLTFLGGIASIYFVLQFIANFPIEGLVSKWRVFRLHRLFSLIMTPIVLTPWFIKSVGGSSFQNGQISTSNLYYLFLLYIVYSVLVLVLVVRKQNISTKSPLQRQQIHLISWGIFLYAFFAVTANVVIPLLSDTWDSSRLGPAFTLVFVSMVAYSIIKHKLFDIRLIIARSLAYILLLATVAGVFTASIFTLTSVFFDEQNLNSSVVKAVYMAIALVVALIFQPLKRFFDKTTNQVFYRDAYDPQDLLNELNRSLVTTIDLEELLKRSSKIIGDTIKTEYCIFAIRDSQNHGFSLTGGSTAHFDEEAVQNIAIASNHVSSKAVVSDELETDKHHLKEQMQKANIAMLMKLEGKVQGHVQHPGYILLGQKKSGGLYSSQDLQILEIIADELVIAIQNALRFEEIQQFNITLRQKIDAATKELRRTNSKLKALDAAKDEFISMASHQLRTPLTAIKGYLSMILDGDTGPVKPKQKDMIQQSFDGSQRMVYLIADLLNVSRMQTGKFVIDSHPANLAEMIVGEMAQLKDQAEAKKIIMNYKKPNKFPVLNLDETKVRQVIMNFLDNALYYTPNGGNVEIKLAETADSVSFTVTDTGVGVPKAVQHNLFTKFYRADNARKMRPDGTGLGLFMAKKVVVAQGGAIIFNSVEGKGSTFGFTFPRAGMEVRAGDKSAQTPIQPKDPLAK